ncbi:MAG: response regulator [Bacteroidales bacterium]|nr:response regulator [Bacteroidales bacterium]
MKKILIVDDSASIRDVLSFVLKEEGFEVFMAEDGVDAQKHLNGQQLDLIITDLYMPNMDGIELIKKIRSMSDYERTPILFLTTESQNEKKSEAKEAGATGWIVKPFVQKNLIAAIMKVMK